MKSIFSIVRIAVLVLTVAGFMQAIHCRGDVSFNIQAVNLQDAGGAPLNGLVVFVASRSNASFSLPTTTNFVSGDDIVLARFDCADGFLDASVSSLVLQNGWDPNDPLAIYWFPTLSTSSPTNAIPAGTPYGFFNDPNNLFAAYNSEASPWITPGDGSLVTIQFVTASQGGPYAETAGLASSVVPSGNTAPVANPDTFVRVAGLTWKTAITNLTANDTNTAGGSIGFSSVITPSTNTVPVSNDTQYVYYSGTNALADRFSYIITNSSGITATGTVTLTISTNPVTGQALTISNAIGNVTASFAGIPGYSYTIQRATNVNFSGTIDNLVTTNAPAAGLFRWTDSNPPTPAAYYRLRYNSP